MKFLPKKMLPTSRQRRPPPAESESALDRTNHVSLHSRRSRIRAYSKYDYPAANDSLGDTGHGTQTSSASPIPSKITIKWDDLHDGAVPGSGGGSSRSSSPWLFRRAPPPAVDNSPQPTRGTSRIEGDEDEDADDEEQATHAEIRHDGTSIEQSNKEHNDNSAAMAENIGNSHLAQNSPSDASLVPESSRSAAPPSYDECVQLGLFDNDNKHRTTTESDTGTSNNIRTETTTTTKTTTTSDALATGMSRGVYASASVPNSMEPISSSSAAQTNSTPFPFTNDDLLSYGFQDEDDEEGADVRARVDKRQQRGFARRSTTTTITTTTTTAAATRSIQSAPPPSTGPAPTRLVHQDSLLSTPRSMASEESVREEMARILAALHAQEQQQDDAEEQHKQGEKPASRPSTKSTKGSGSRSSPPPSSLSSSSSTTSAKRPVYLDVPMGTSLYPQLGHPVPPRQGSE